MSGLVGRWKFCGKIAGNLVLIFGDIETLCGDTGGTFGGVESNWHGGGGGAGILNGEVDSVSHLFLSFYKFFIKIIASKNMDMHVYLCLHKTCILCPL